MIGAEAERKLDILSLSDNTVQRCISDMSNDIKTQISEETRNSPMFAIQLIKSTDVSTCAQVMVYVSYIPLVWHIALAQPGISAHIMFSVDFGALMCT